MFSVDLMLKPDKVKGVDQLANEHIGKPMCLRMAMKLENDKYKSPYRYFHGICNRFALVGKNARFHYYRAELVPWTWLLTQQSRLPDL